MILLRRNSKQVLTSKKLIKENVKSFLYSLYYSSNQELKIEEYVNKNCQTFKQKEPLVFENGLFPILKNTSKINKKYIRSRNVTLPINAVLAYKFVRNVLICRPLKSVMYGTVLLFVSIFTFEFNKKLEHLVEKIDLLQCGKVIRITLANKKVFDLETIRLRMINKTELECLVFFEDSILNNYYPIVANRKIYFIPKECEIHHEILFQEIMKGNIISIESKIFKENSLNI
jgi:hypothetical protein